MYVLISYHGSNIELRRVQMYFLKSDTSAISHCFPKTSGIFTLTTSRIFAVDDV